MWFARFEIFRRLGAGRTVGEAFRRCVVEQGLRGKRPGSAWYEACEAYRWFERAEAWDVIERKRLEAEELNRRFDARELRLRIIASTMEAAAAALAIADVAGLTKAQARLLLGQVRLLLRDSLSAQRQELGMPALVVEADEVVATFSGDELARAFAELEEYEVVARNGYLSEPALRGA